MSVKFTLNSAQVPDGTILLFGIRYEAGPDWRPSPGKIYTYVMIKAGGFWYVTGGGRTPQVAGWGAVERWLERDGRVVEWVRHVTETAQLWPPVATHPAKLPADTSWIETTEPGLVHHDFQMKDGTRVTGVVSPDEGKINLSVPAGSGEDLSDSDQRRYRDEEPLNPGGMNPDGSIDGMR